MIPKIMTFHVERLYDDRVWKYFSRLLGYLEKRAIRSTCFVLPPLHPRHITHPQFGANGEKKFRDRLLRIREGQHEIQLHSHFYQLDEKKQDLSIENVRRVIRTEKAYLENLGYPITGFIGGGFNVSPDVIQVLSEFGMEYDCSVSAFQKTYLSAVLEGISGPVKLPEGVYEIPTTHTLKMASLKKLAKDGDRYVMPYAHDYDFVNTGYRIGLKILFLRAGTRNWRTVRENMALLFPGYAEKQ